MKKYSNGVHPWVPANCKIIIEYILGGWIAKYLIEQTLRTLYLS